MNCKFCIYLFSELTENQTVSLKKRIFLLTKEKQDNKDEEFFRMCLLQYQMQNKDNLKIMSLDYRNLYK